jgi:hypothetical protein
MSDLPKRLRIKASMIALGERIAWGSDTALMEEAADVIEALSESVENHQLHMLGMARDRDQLRALLTAQSAPAGEREACSECNGLGFGPFGGCGECCGSGQSFAAQQRTQSAWVPEGYALVPVDPTPKMLVAYMEADGAIKRWKAMIAAAQAQPAAQDQPERVSVPVELAERLVARKTGESVDDEYAARAELRALLASHGRGEA